MLFCVAVGVAFAAAAAGVAFAAAAAGVTFAAAAAGVTFAAAAEAALSGDHHIPVAVSVVLAAVGAAAVHTGSAWEVFAEVLPVLA